MKNFYSLLCVCIIFISSSLAQNSELLNEGLIKLDVPNLISVHVEGGDFNYADNLYIRFMEGATFGYDVEFEMIKWYSINSDATMIWSETEEGLELSINALPISCLYNGITSVPIHFQCGYDNEYTLTFSGMDGFEYPTEFWLEDLSTGEDWFSINRDVASYTFQGYVSDSSINRFVMHFLDPTGTDELPEILPDKQMKIYASQYYAYIQNNSSEFIKEIEVFDLVGNEVPIRDQSFGVLNKYYVSSQTGYYFIKVITDENIYTKKVFIGQ